MRFTPLIRVTRTCLTQKYAGFTGRGSRSEYWWFSVTFVAAAAIIAAAATAAGMPLLGLAIAPLILPMMSAAVRRLHDTSRSGWWMLIALIPVVGPFVYLAIMAIDSTPGANRFGLSPKTVVGSVTERLYSETIPYSP